MALAGPSSHATISAIIDKAAPSGALFDVLLCVMMKMKLIKNLKYFTLFLQMNFPEDVPFKTAHVEIVDENGNPLDQIKTMERKLKTLVFMREFGISNCKHESVLQVPITTIFYILVYQYIFTIFFFFWYSTEDLDLYTLDTLFMSRCQGSGLSTEYQNVK